MCSVWVHDSTGPVCLLPSKFLVLATEEFDCRRGLFSTSPGRRTFLRPRGSGQQTKSSCTQQQTTHHTQSLCSVHTQPRSSSFVINRRAQDVRSRARTRRNPRVLACLLQLWLEVLRGNHNTRHLRRSYSMAGQKLIARTQRGTVLDRRLAAARGR